MGSPLPWSVLVSERQSGSTHLRHRGNDHRPLDTILRPIPKPEITAVSRTQGEAPLAFTPAPFNSDLTQCASSRALSNVR